VQAVDLGLTSRNLLLLVFDPRLERRPEPKSTQLLRDFLEKARIVPGAESATLTSAVPLMLTVCNSNVVAADNAPTRRQQAFARISIRHAALRTDRRPCPVRRNLTRKRSSCE